MFRILYKVDRMRWTFLSFSPKKLKVGAGREMSRKSPGVGVPDGHTGMSK